MTTAQLILISLTALAVAAIAGRAYVAVRKADADARVVVADREARTAVDQRKALAPLADLNASVATLERTARALEEAAGERAPSRVGQRVTVHTKQPDDQTLHGVVAAEYTDVISLKDAAYITPNGPHPLPDRQDIDKVDIAWIDVHGHVTVPAAVPAEA